jgi:hypothetical protein
MSGHCRLLTATTGNNTGQLLMPKSMSKYYKLIRIQCILPYLLGYVLIKQ